LAKEEKQTEPSRPLQPVPAAALSPWERALKKSSEPLSARLLDVWTKASGGEAWNDKHPMWESLEEVLLISDVGPKLTQRLLQELKKEFRERPDPKSLRLALRSHMQAILELAPAKESQPASGPRVTLLMGVNGAGKTTTAGKLAFQAKAAGKTVILGAGDTFRAAAVEQLEAWAKRIGVECVVPAKGANPAAVAFDTVAAGLARNIDEIIIDTAGRLHTKDSLMEELRKVGKVIDKKIPGAPHRVLLVLDATLGQNAILQAKEFTAALPATGVVLTKLDGSAKGGAAFSVVADLGLPVELVGLGESPEALAPFSPAEFTRHLIPDS
jgi:fused signal recognition particle receptor